MSQRNRKKSLLYLNQPNDTLKQVSFFMPESSYLQLRSDMEVDEIRRVNDFMCELTRLYLEKDEDMLTCINKIKDIITRQSLTRRKHLSEEYLKGEEILNKFKILDEDERQQLFDIIEGEIDIDETTKV